MPSSGTDAHALRPSTTGMAPVPAVARSDDVALLRSPCVHDALDRRGSQVRAVRQADDGSLRVPGERREPTAEGRSRAALPLRARDEPCGAGIELMGARDDDDLVQRGLAEPRQHAGQEQALLRLAEPARSAGGQDDCRDHSALVVTARMSARCTRRKV